MNDWLQAQVECEKQGLAYVLVSVSQVAGSSPRNLGAKMLVTQGSIASSIGGGHLEHKAIKQAKVWLHEASGKHHTQIQEYTLGANLGQCCGGKVSLIYEYRAPQRVPIVVFGAGHVGRALVPILAQLPVAVTWVDGRYDMLPKSLPENVTKVHEEYPVDAIADCPAGACYLIMTHHHGLDLQLAEAALKRRDTRYVGVIGSRTKAARFRHQLLAKELGDVMDHFHCPMGNPQIKGKQPIEIAISVTAQVMSLYQQDEWASPAYKNSYQPALMSKTEN